MASSDFGGRPAKPGSVQAQGGIYPRYDSGGGTGPATPEEEAPKKPGIISSVKRGVGSALASTGQAGEDVGLPTTSMREYGQKLEAENPASVTDLPGILQHPLQFTKETIGELAPQFGISVAGAATGARLGALGNIFGPEIGGPTTVAGGVLGAFAPSFVQSYGGQRIDQNAQGIDDRKRAALAAAGSAALDVVGPEEMLARRLATGAVRKGETTGLKGVAKEVGKGALFEGATEGAQEYIEGYGTTGQTSQDPGAIAMAAAKGAVGGGVAGGVTHVVGKRKEDKTQNIPEETAPAETLALPPPGTSTEPTQLLLTDQRADKGAPAVEGPPSQAALPAPEPRRLPAPEDTSVIRGEPPPGQSRQLPAPRTQEDLDTIDTPTLMARGIKPVESGGRTGAVSPVGALGVHQMMPATARQVANRLGEEYRGDQALRWNDAYNNHLATAYMDQLRDDFGGDTFLAVSAYHAGPGNVRKWVRQFGYDPANKQAFLDKIHDAGNPESAKYANLVLKAMGRDTFGGPGHYGEVTVADASPDAISKRITDLSGETGEEHADLKQSLAEGIAKGGEEAARIVTAQDTRLKEALANLAANEKSMLPDEVQRQHERLAAQERILDAAVNSAHRLAKARGPNIVTQPGPLDTSNIPGMQGPNAELAALGQDLMQQGQEAAAQHAANQLSARSQMEQGQALTREQLAARDFAFKDIMRSKSRTPREDLQRIGFDISPEHDLMLKARESYLRSEDQAAAVKNTPQIQPEAMPQGEAPVEAPKPTAETKEAAVPSPAQTQREFHNDVIRQARGEHEKTIAYWREQGARAALGLPHATPGTSVSKTRGWFDKGGEIARERQDINTPQAPTEVVRPTKPKGTGKPQAKAEAKARQGPKTPRAQEAARAGGARAERRAAADEAIRAAAQAQAEAAAQPKTEAGKKAASTSKSKGTARTEGKARTGVKAEAATTVRETAPKAPEPAQSELARELAKEGKSHTTEDEARQQLIQRINRAGLSPAEATQLRNRVTDTTKGKPTHSVENLTTMLDKVLGPEKEVASTRQRQQAPRPGPEASREDVKRYWQNVKDATRAELDRAGLKDVDLKFFAKMLNDAMGSYVAPDENPALRHLIQLSLNHDEQLGTLDHEIIHAMREMDLFTPAEWDALVEAATADEEIHTRIERDYAQSHPDVREEEKVAELYRKWAEGQTRPDGPIAKLLAKIKATLKAIGIGFKRQGTATPEAVLKRIMSGEVGARQRGYTRGERGVRAGGVSRAEARPNGEIGPIMGGLWRKAEGPSAMPKARTPEAFARRTTTERAARAVETAGFNLTKKLHLWLTGTEDMSNIMARHMQMPSARRVVDLHSRSHALGRAFQERLVRIKDDYQNLSAALKGTGDGSVSKFLYDSTISGKWGYAPPGIANAVVDPKLAERFNAMPDEAQKVIKDIFKFGNDSRAQMRDALVANVNAEFDPLIRDADTAQEQAKWERQKARALKNFDNIYAIANGKPYSPLKREGAWAVVGKSDAYRAAEKAKNTKLIDELAQDPKHYFVDFRDTSWEAEALHHHVEQQFGGEGAYYFERSKTPPPGAINSEELYLAFSQLKNAVAAGADGSKTSERLQRMVNDLYLHSLAEASARKAELGRSNVSAVDPVTGETMNMVEAFVSRGNATANYIASIENGPQIQKALTDMAAEMHQLPSHMKTDGSRMYNEMMYRYTANLGKQPNRMADKIVRGVSLWTLLSSPFYYAQNFTQAALISAPVLASKYGGGAYGHIFQGYADFVNMTKAGGARGGVLDFTKAPADVADKVDANGNVIEKGILHRLAERGRLDAGYSNELGRWEMDGDGLLPKSWNVVDKFLRRTPQWVETANRVATGIAAYRAHMEGKADTKENRDAAFEVASKLIHDTHGDYSGFNSPTPFTASGSIGKVALQFRKFQLIMGGLIAREFHRTFKGATPEERMQGFKALGFLGAHMAVAGGILAQPGMDMLGPVIGALMNLIDEDDDKDWSNWQEDLRVALGAGGEGAQRNMLADFLYKGAPYALLSMDTSDRLGMGNIASLAPYSDLPEALSSKEKAKQQIADLMLGPSGGLVSKAIDGWGFGMQQGDWVRSVEALAPSGLSNLMKAVRLKNEGLTSKQGDVLVPAERVSDLDAFYTAMGVRPRSLVNQAERRSTEYSAEEYYTAKTTQLKRDYVKAVKAKDGAARQAAEDEFEAIQKARLRDGFARQPKSTLLKAPQAQAKREKGVIGGVETNKQNREFVARMMFADDPAQALDLYGADADF